MARACLGDARAQFVEKFEVEVADARIELRAHVEVVDRARARALDLAADSRQHVEDRGQGDSVEVGHGLAKVTRRGGVGLRRSTHHQGAKLVRKGGHLEQPEIIEEQQHSQRSEPSERIAPQPSPSESSQKHPPGIRDVCRPREELWAAFRCRLHAILIHSPFPTGTGSHSKEKGLPANPEA